MYLTLAPIFLSSLLGSLHCVAMCGGFAFSCAQSNHTQLSSILYNLGRLITYVLLGALAASLGRSIDSLALHYNLPNIAAYLLGTLLIVSGALSLIGPSSAWGRSIKAQSSLFLANLYGYTLNKFGPSFSSNARPILIGLLSTLLPCGWLYSFVALAGTSSSVLEGIIIMFVFWLGTLPILALAGSLSQILLSKLGSILPKISAVLIILAGIFAILQHNSQHHHHSNHSSSYHNQHNNLTHSQHKALS